MAIVSGSGKRASTADYFTCPVEWVPEWVRQLVPAAGTLSVLAAQHPSNKRETHTHSWIPG